MTISMYLLSQVLLWPGCVLVLIAVFPTQSLPKFFAMIVGCVLLAGGGAVRAFDFSAPTPPTPPPTPTPIGPFADLLRQSFTGTKAESQIIGALHNQFADALAFDGSRPTPRIGNTTQMGQSFAELARYRSGAEAPWGQRFAPLEQAIAAEAVRRQIIVLNQSQPLDAVRRAAAVLFFREVGAALCG